MVDRDLLLNKSQIIERCLKRVNPRSRGPGGA